MVIFSITKNLQYYFRNYPISFAKTQENISQILLKSEEPKRKVAANLLCWKCKAENMENCYEKGEIEICDGRLVSLKDRPVENRPLDGVTEPFLLPVTTFSFAICYFRSRVASKKEDGKESWSELN